MYTHVYTYMQYMHIWIDFKTYKCSNMYTPSTLASASGMWYDLTATQFPINCGAITLIKLYRFYSHNLSSIWHYLQSLWFVFQSLPTGAATPLV